MFQKGFFGINENSAGVHVHSLCLFEDNSAKGFDRLAALSLA